MHSNKSAFINAETLRVLQTETLRVLQTETLRVLQTETLRVLDSAHTYAQQGIGGHALQRRDSGRFYLRFDF